MTRIWINIALLITFAYGAYGVLDHTNNRFSSAHWQYYLYAISPWALLFSSLKAWYRSYIWRRMMYQRQSPQILSRGHHRTEKNLQRPGILEYACVALLLLAIAAILRQLGAPHIAWWIGSLAGAWTLLRIIVKKVA
ncbi:MAG: hypothetical protein AB2535_19950 [Candidatus Thiodiazotropha endolucinida]